MNYIKFFQTVMQLKQVKRTGWTRYPLKDVESVADHSFGVAFMAATIPLPDEVDREKLIKMGIMHDAIEGICGDLVHESKVANTITKEDKQILEKKAADKLFELIDDKIYKELFFEYEEQKSIESKYCKQMDKLEMAFQALTYEKELGESKPLDEFWDTAKKHGSLPEIKTILDELYAMRTK